MAEVVNRGNDSVDKMLKILKKQMEKAGIIGELKKRVYYVKPSVKKKLKHSLALRNLEKRRKKEGYYD